MMRGAYFWLAHEDAVLRRYLSSPCPWDEVMPSLPGRTEFGARKRLQRLREEAGTLWRIDTREFHRRRAASLPRENGAFA